LVFICLSKFFSIKNLGKGSLSTKEVLESYGKRFGIEEMFKDLKEVWGCGKQEVRKLGSNEGVTVLNMTMYNLVELSTWSVSGEALRNRSDCGRPQPPTLTRKST
jgi:hypothetical protein